MRKPSIQQGTSCTCTASAGKPLNLKATANNGAMTQGKLDFANDSIITPHSIRPHRRPN